MKVNIPFLDIIKQVPSYEKFFKDLCTIKKGLGIEKKAFLTEQVSAIIQSKNPVKYKDPGSPSFLQLKFGCLPHPGLYVSKYGELKGFLW